MAQNKLTDLNNHLFAQLERLGDESISQENLEKELRRSKAISEVAKNIIENAKTSLEGVKVAANYIDGGKQMPEPFIPKNKSLDK